MILEYKNYVQDSFVEKIQQQVKPFLSVSNNKPTYNRDGITVNITETKELSSLDEEISSVFKELSTNVINRRFKPLFPSGDSGYEYHLYRPMEICHFHSDGEVANNLLRYATVILFLTNNDDGNLVFPSQNVEIKPEKGKVVIFPPYGMFSHYSKPSEKNREILMTWFVYNNVRVNTNAT